jgi:phage repressor protein C with HTH and peptisase S24 domain
MKAVAGVKSDTALARVLGINQSSVSSAKERQSIPSAWAMLLSEKFGASIDWLWTGEGEMKRGGAQFASVKQTRELMEGRAPETRRTQWSDAAPTEPANAPAVHI